MRIFILVRTIITREESISPNPIRPQSQIPIITDITAKSLADLFVGVYLNESGLTLAKKDQTNFTNQIQKCINILHTDIKQKKLLMKKIITTLKTSENSEIFQLHITPNTKFQAKFMALFGNDFQDNPPPFVQGVKFNV